MDECEWMQGQTRSRLESLVLRNERPNWYDWFGMYPAKSAVDAAKVTLEGMDGYEKFMKTSMS